MACIVTSMHLYTYLISDPVVIATEIHVLHIHDHFNYTKTVKDFTSLRDFSNRGAWNGRTQTMQHRSSRSHWCGKTGRMDHDRDRGTTTRDGTRERFNIKDTVNEVCKLYVVQ